MRARKLAFFTAGVLLLGTISALSEDPVPSDSVLDAIESWPVEGFSCSYLTAFRFERD